MGDAGAETAQEVEKKITQVAQVVLDVVAENPQEPHVADQVHPATVQKHAGEQGEDRVAERDVGMGREETHPRGHHPQGEEQLLQATLTESDFVEKS